MSPAARVERSRCRLEERAGQTRGAPSSELKLQPELQDSGICRRSEDLSEAPVIHVHHRTTEINPVGNIEILRAELEPHVLPNEELLCDHEVHVGVTGSANNVSAVCSTCAERSIRE